MRKIFISWIFLCLAVWAVDECIARAHGQPTQIKLLLIGNTKVSCPLPTFNGALVAHWTGDSGITQASSQVSQWTDTVAALNLTQATTANKPKFLPTGYNGKPAVQLFGSVGGGGFANSMMQTAANALTTSTVGASTFIVGQLSTNTDATGFGRAVSYQANGDANDGGTHSFILLRDGTTANLAPFVAGGVQTDVAVSLNTNIRIGYTADFTSNTNNVLSYLNGVLQHTDSRVNGGLVSTGTVGIGANVPQSGANVWLDAIEREIVIYNAVLNGAQVTTLDSYFTCNNGI